MVATTADHATIRYFRQGAVAAAKSGWTLNGENHVPSASVSAALENEKRTVYANFGRACLADICDDWVIYRNLEPLDKRVPGLKHTFYNMELRSEQIPRKQDRDYTEKPRCGSSTASSRFAACAPRSVSCFPG